MPWGSRNRWALRLATVLTLAALTLIGAAPTLADAAISTKFPIDIVVFVSCANGGAGEDVELTDNLNDVFHLTFDNAGGIHLKGHDNPQGLRGVGLTTGNTYQGTGVTQFEFNAKVGEENTFVNNFRIIGRGPGNNYLVHETFHFTANANGTVTVEHDKFSIECK